MFLFPFEDVHTRNHESFPTVNFRSSPVTTDDTSHLAITLVQEVPADSGKWKFLRYMTNSIAVLEDSYSKVVVNAIDLALNWQLSEEGVQAYGGSNSSVTYSGNILNEIGVMRFLCNKIAMSDGFVKKNLALTDVNDLSLDICILLVVKSLHSSRDCWPCSRLCVKTL